MRETKLESVSKQSDKIWGGGAIAPPPLLTPLSYEFYAIVY